MSKIIDKKTKSSALNRKNRIISSIIISCYLIQSSFINLGCYSYVTVKNEDINNVESIKSNERIKFVLKDHLEIEALTSKCFLIKKDSNLLYCKGLVYDSTEVRPSEFEGFIKAEQIDSTRYIEGGSIPHWLYWLNNRKMLRLDVLNVCDLRKINNNRAWFIIDIHNTYRVIYLNDIYQIQTPKINWAITSLFIIGSVVLIFMIAAAAGAGANAIGNISLGGTW